VKLGCMGRRSDDGFFKQVQEFPISLFSSVSE
jgi:hypothetical protein